MIRPRCDFGGCPRRADVQLVARDEAGVTIERRPMCQSCADYASTVVYHHSIEALPTEETTR